MRLIVGILSSVVLVGICLLVPPNSSLAQQKQPPRVRLEAKRSADLPADQRVQVQPNPIDINKVKVFDRVSGICLGRGESVVVGASVKLYRKSHDHQKMKDTEELVASAETGSDGKFAFENLQARFPTDKFDKYFILVVRKQGYATKFLNSIIWTTGDQEIELSNRAMVKGVIRNDVGQPIANAAVSFYHPLKKSLPDVYATKTDAEGKFEIDDYHTVNSVAYKTAAGKTRGSRALPLIVEHPDYGKVSLMIERTPNIFIVTISRGAKFTGRIVDDKGNPVADCQISMQSHDRQPQSQERQPHIWFETTSDKDGNFRFTKLADIRVNLFFKTDDLIGKAIELSGESGSETDLGDLRIIQPIVVQGVVIDDETDEPLRLNESQMYSVGWHGPERPKTSAGISRTEIKSDGTFECRFLPGKNYPYISSGYLEMVDRPYKDGIEITTGSNIKLEFRVRRKQMDDESNKDHHDD